MDELDDLIYYFVDDNELLELINSDVSYTMTDEGIMGKNAKWNNENDNNNYQYITFWDTTKIYDTNTGPDDCNERFEANKSVACLLKIN